MADWDRAPSTPPRAAPQATADASAPALVDAAAEALSKEAAAADAASTSASSSTAAPAGDVATQEVETVGQAAASTKDAKAAVKSPKLQATIQALKQAVIAANLDGYLLKPSIVWTLAALFVYVLARYNFSFFFCILVLPVVIGAERVLIQRKIRRGVADELLKHANKMFPDHESVEWINQVFSLVWLNYNLFIAETVIAQVNPQLQKQKPTGVRDMGLSKFDLGKRPPKLKNFMVYRNDPSKFIMDIELYWDADFDIRVFATPTISPMPMTVKVSNLFLDTRMRVEATLLPNAYPFVKLVAVQMLVPPKIDVDVAVVSVSVTDIPGFAQLIRSLIVTNVSKIFCPPRKFEVDVLDILGEDPSKVKERLQVAQKKQSLLKDTGSAISGGVGAVTDLGGAVIGGAMKGVGAGFKGVSAVGGAGIKGVGAIGGAGLSGLKKGSSMIMGNGRKSMEGVPTSPSAPVVADDPADTAISGTNPAAVTSTPGASSQSIPVTEETAAVSSSSSEKRKKKKSFGSFFH
eukprot:jgi/Chlat1/8731/Chrsp9S08559